MQVNICNHSNLTLPMSITSSQSESLLFQLRHIAQLPLLQSLDSFAHADEDTVRMILEQAASFAADVLAPLAVSGDIEGCRLVTGCVYLPSGTPQAYRDWCDLGFPGLGLPTKQGGLGFPRVVQSAVQELSDGANLAFGMLAINLRCAALALLENGSARMPASWISGLVDGSIASTIVISEPQAGSDVGRIRTAATPQPDGSWRLTGSKLWISYGDHDAAGQILHLVLARVPNGEVGTRGLGLFTVPKRLQPAATSPAESDNGVSVLRLEHKMGLHASPTCVLDFKEACGELIGEAGRGLQALFVMMNAMRLAVAVQGAAVANVATLHAIRYASERPQGGHPLQAPVMIAQHPDVRRMLLEMTAQAELSRALALRTAACLDRAEALQGEEAAHWQSLGELLLPIAKTLNAENAFSVASQGIQVLGGYGYTNDYPLERLARDIRVASIYEGTSGIQALDFLKRKVLADKGRVLQQLLCLIRKELASGTSPYSSPAPAVLTMLEQTVDSLQRDSAAAEEGAYALLQLAGLAVHGWNGHVLYLAAEEQQHNLCAALKLHAASLLDTARLWSAKATTPLPACNFHPC